MRSVWERLVKGRPVLVVGVTALPRPEDESILLVQVDCYRARQPLGPLLVARDTIELHLAALGAARGGAATPSGDRPFALRRRLLGEGDDGEKRSLVDVVARLRAATDRALVIELDDVGAADLATHKLLRSMLRQSGVLNCGIVFTCESEHETMEVERLIETLVAQEGPEAVVHVHDAVPLPPPPEPVESRGAFDRLELPFDVLRVLRAGAVVGDRFEVDIVATLLGLEGSQVLELLQHACDLGVAIQDDGAGVLGLPLELATRLRASTLPSLASTWHHQIALLMSEAETGPMTQPLPQVGSLAPERQAPAGDEPRPPAPSPRPSPRSEGFGVAGGAPPPSPDLGVFLEPLVPPASSTAASPGAAEGRSSRAAEHAEAAGQADLAADRYLAAAREAALVGAYDRAIEVARHALALLAGQPPSARRRQLRIALLAELGRIQWQAAGPGRAFSLAGALESLDECRRLLEDDDPVGLRARISSLIAGVCYDIGEPRALERALRELADASRELLDAGEPLDAATLLNDEAAVWVKLGKPERAMDLLKRSRAVFTRFALQSRTARVELAETDHLLARLLLHAPSDAQSESKNLQFALERARSAEETYEALGQPRELARVWETLGRLERLAGAPEVAREHLSAALRVQQRLGDMLGLARTTAAMADIVADTGQLGEALVLLAESIELNLEKGSLEGLESNREALDGLAARLTPGERKRLAPAMEKLRAMLP